SACVCCLVMSPGAGPAQCQGRRPPPGLRLLVSCSGRARLPSVPGEPGSLVGSNECTAFSCAAPGGLPNDELHQRSRTLPVIRRLLRGSDWRREVLRTNLWLVPAVEVVAAVVLFAATYALDRAAFAGDFKLPGWLLSGSPDAARQILTAIAAAIITVVGVVFSIVIVALTLTSTQFGPRMLRNFIRDRGTQVTLGTFVATFVYAVLALGSIGQGGPAFVPKISITVTLALMVADLAVLIYFLQHITTQIQLPQVIAGIAGDLAGAIELQAGDGAADSGSAAARLVAGLHGPGGATSRRRAAATCRTSSTGCWSGWPQNSAW